LRGRFCSNTKALATATFNLVELNRKLDSSGRIDDRARARNNSWEKAIMALEDFIELLPSTPDKERLVRLTANTCNGFFSMWIQVFKDYPEVKKAILENVNGTSLDCYNEDFNPIENILR